MSNEQWRMSDSLRRIADLIDQIGFPESRVGYPLQEEYQIGAGKILMYLRDLFTGTPKEVFTRDEVLVILNTIQSDPELFTLDVVAALDLSQEE